MYTSTTAALKLESTLPHTLPHLAQRIFPSYLTAATQWSNLLSSGLAPVATALGNISGERQEAVKRWRMCLERADLVKKKVAAMGGEVVAKPVATRKAEVVEQASVNREEEGARRRKEDEAEQVNILRRSSVIRHQRQEVSNSATAIAFSAAGKKNELRLPLWHDADGTFITPLTTTQLDSLVACPDFSPDQKAWNAKWENIYTPTSPWVPFEPFLPSFSKNVDAEVAGHTGAAAVKVSQGIGANCSVVAGLNVLVAHNARQRGSRELGVQNFVDVRVKPERGDVHYGEDAGKRYWRVKVFVNGAWRSLVIDSCLPTSTKTDEPLHCIVTPDPPTQPIPTLPSLLWLPLLEKTYTTLLASSYAFPGSTPSTDLFHLTGWIPERIPLTRGSFQRERTWQRVERGWRDGTVLITLGTGKDQQQRNVIRDPRVVPLHAYAVVDVRHGHGQAGGDERKVKVVNPWRRDRSRTGSNGRQWTRGMLQALVEEAEDEDAEPEEPPGTLSRYVRPSPSHYSRLDPLFRLVDSWWMSWDEVCNTFDTLNLNWDPRIFERSETVHAVHTDTDDDDSIEITVSALSPGADVWILLQRHITTFATADTTFAAVNHDRNDSEGEDGTGISMAMQIVENVGEVVRSRDVWARPSGAALEFTSSSWILTQHKCLTEKATLSIRPRFEPSSTVSEAGNADGIAYTVTVYSDANILARKRTMAYGYEKVIDVDFFGRTAGGNPSHPTFMHNPQYRVHIKPDISQMAEKHIANVKCQLVGEDHTSYNVKLVWHQGERVTDLQAHDVVADSGEYRYGQASFTKTDVGVGIYTLVASSFEAGRASKAALKIQSTLPLDVSPIPQEGAGMFSRVVKGQWSGTLAAGRPSLGSYEQNPRYELLLPEPATVLCRLQLATTTGTPIPISVTIFKRGPSGSLKRQVATSGPYADPISGVLIPQTDLEAGIYVVVPSTYAGGTEASYFISVYATRKVELSVL
ncbi:hypothetical protein QFC22_005286 [Naganishia vaughanmartiniae]|uniref:Uncharacterized protein n=1 Tax=Naganishia vaughanmartiniae TaxID=1424756 RepID=A0ACC2WUR2_9TREE|nr:hypothetical protein QFC22_005286 [Naganishia vaughanmartiniae]